MARAPNEKLAKAKELFDKGYKLIDISKELNIPAGTVRRWKKTYNWSNERSNKKSERSVKVNNKKKNNKETIAEEIKQVINNEALSDKQRLFCIFYSKSFNATKAYQKAYGCIYETAMVNGCKLLSNPKIKKQIDALTQIQFNKVAIKNGVIQKYIDIAFSDLGEYIKFGKKQKGAWTKNEFGEDIPVIDPDTGEQKIIEYSYVDLNESVRVDTTLISEISEGKDGIKIKLADKMKALEFLTKHCNLLNDEEKTKLELEYKRLQNEKASAEISKITGNNEPEVEDDGFIQALSGKIAEVWDDET